MSRFRKIDPRIWNDEKFRLLSDHGKLVFFLLLTHPNMTSLGAMRATLPGLAEEIGWTAEGFREAFREGLQQGMIEHDGKAHLIALPAFLKYNSPESPNVIKAWANSVDLLPECNLRTATISRLFDLAESKSQAFQKAFREAFGEAFGEAWRHPSLNKKKEKEKEQKSLPSHEYTTEVDWSTEQAQGTREAVTA